MRQFLQHLVQLLKGLENQKTFFPKGPSGPFFLPFFRERIGVGESFQGVQKRRDRMMVTMSQSPKRPETR